jgi:hypothetical protein
MSMMTLKCPSCNAEAKLSLADNDYSGPRRCWKCHQFFTITIHNNQVTFCEPLSQEEYEREQAERKAAEKAGVAYKPRPTQSQKTSGGINYTKQSQMDFPDSGRPQPGQDAGEEATDIFKILAGKSKGGIDFSPSSSAPATGASLPPPAPSAEKAPVEETAENFDIFNHIKSGTKGVEGSSNRPASEPPPKPMVPKQEFIRPANYEAPLGRPEPKKPAPKTPAPQAPVSQTEPKTKPGPIRTFVPVEKVEVEPENPKKKKTPPADHFNLFVPPQT